MPHENNNINEQFDSNSINNHDRITRRMTVTGFENRTNEVLVSVTNIKATSTLIFFPGDVQDFEANMLMGPHSHLVSYSYEKIATILLHKFGPLTNILIIRPHALVDDTYACFDHFVKCNEYGAVPSTYTPSGTALPHLMALLDTIQATLAQQHIELCIEGPLHLIGFSKGGIVLNQLITEAMEATRINQYDEFISRLLSIHWLDSGNGSFPGAVPNDPSTLQAFTIISHPFKLYIHVTPYQYDAVERPWIRKEIEKWIEAVRQSSSSTIQLIRYYESEPATLTTHFQIIQDMSVVSMKKEMIQPSSSIQMQPIPLLSTNSHG